MAIKVILADDHSIVRIGIRTAVSQNGDGIEIVEEASDGRELLELAENNPADVYVVDISMPLLNGLEATERLLRMDPRSKIIVLSMHDDKGSVEKAIRCGAKGYVVKENAVDEIAQAIHDVYKGGYFLSPCISQHIVQGFLANGSRRKQHRELTDLTGREREILQLVSEGFTTKDIARQLHRSVNTIRVHRSNLMRKLNIHKQAELIHYAFKEGIGKL